MTTTPCWVAVVFRGYSVLSLSNSNPLVLALQQEVTRMKVISQVLFAFFSFESFARGFSFSFGPTLTLGQASFSRQRRVIRQPQQAQQQQQQQAPWTSSFSALTAAGTPLPETTNSRSSTTSTNTSAKESSSSLWHLAQQGLHLPAAVLLGLVLLPLLVSKAQALSTFALFGGLKYYGQGGWKSTTADDDRNSGSNLWGDVTCLGLAAATASWLTPQPQHPAVAVATAHASSSGPPVLACMFCAAVLFVVAPKLSSFLLDDNKTTTNDLMRDEEANLENSSIRPKTKKAQEPPKRQYDEVHQRRFNSWDEKLQNRQA